MADSSLDLNKALQDLASQNQGMAIPFPIHRIQVAKTGANFADNQRLLSVFSEAFPDMEFEALNDEQGRPSIRSKPKLARASETEQAIPEGYSTSLANQGIKDLQVALENAKDDEERFSIASRLNTLVQTQKAYHFSEYKKRAEAEFGVPDLTLAIERVRQVELASPFNPGTGMPSAERMTLIESLGQARSRANARIQEMLSHDPVLASAEALAKGTISELQGRLLLEGRQELLDDRKRKKEARAAAISAMDPAFLEAVSIIRYNQPAKDLVSIAEQIVDGKLKLTETERLLASADNDNLKTFYISTKNPKEKALTIQILTEREKAVVQDDKQAKRNIELFKTISEKNISNEADTSIPPEIRRRYKQAQTEVTAQAAASGRTRDEMLAERTVALKREMLTEVLKSAFYFDVGQWNGLIKSDQTALAVMKQAGTNKLNLTKFTDSYLAYNDGRTLADKGKALQAIITSSTEAIPRSAVLPIPSAESILLEAQRIIAQSALNYYHKNPVSSVSALFGEPFADFWNNNNIVKGRGQ